MNDQTDTHAGNGADTDESAAAPQLMIGPQYIRDLSFENPLGLEGIAEMTNGPEISIDVKTTARPVADETYEVVLSIRVDARIGDKTAFIVELSYGGAFQLAGVPRESARPVMLIEGPRHLFPFARAIVSDVVRDGGFQPLMINPIDFAALYAGQLEKEGESDGA